MTKILLIDIETAPNQVYTWGLWDQNIRTNQILETSSVLCWSAKWLGGKQITFSSVQSAGRDKMLGAMHKLLDEADIVVHYNGTKFDIPTLNKEFIEAGFAPPAPYKQIDCLRVVRQMFRFQSNKLNFVSQALGLGAKAKTEGFELWVKCIAGDKAAWKRMGRYNRRDVVILEKLYKRLRPWIEKHPNLGAFEGKMACPKCGSQKKQQRGYAVTQQARYPRFQCLACAAWFRGTKSLLRHKGERAANIG